MKLSSVDYYLDWPVSIKLKNLREFIIANLEKKGDVIRWSIVLAFILIHLNTFLGNRGAQRR